MEEDTPESMVLSTALTNMRVDARKPEFLGNAYQELAKHHISIERITVGPSNWPRKLYVKLQNKGDATKLMQEGIDMFGVHVEWKEDSSIFTRVTVKDAPLEWEADYIENIMKGYGIVARVEMEKLVLNGKKIDVGTGNWLVYMSKIEQKIPARIEHY